MRGLRKSALQFRDEVRIRQRLAEFLRAAREGCYRDGDRQKIHDDADGSVVRKVWRSSRPCFPRRSGANWSSLLHELGGVEAGEGRIATASIPIVRRRRLRILPPFRHLP